MIKCILGDPGAVSGSGEKSKQARKKIGQRKAKNENRSPWDSSLNRPVPKPFKSLPVIGHKNIFCAQSESSSFLVTFMTSYSKVFTAKLFDRLFAIYLLARAEEFPSIENENHETEKKKTSKFSMFVNQPEKSSTEKIRLWTNRR